MASPIAETWVHATMLIENEWGKYGTGFIVARNVDGKNVRAFLVTNKHVLSEDPQQRARATRIRLHVNKKNAQGIVEGETIDVPLANGPGMMWREHPNRDVDVLAFDITPLLVARPDIEREGATYDYEAESTFQRPRDGPHWYEYLFQRLGPKRVDYEQSKLSIITFNYDRSLEHFLFRSLRAAFGLSEDECRHLLQKVPVVHVYGQLGALDYMSPDGRRYHPDLSPQTVAKYAKEIKIVHEGRSGTPEFTLARELLAGANTIFFLGFGYHETNMERLHLEDAKKHAKVFGCVKGMTDAEAGEIERRLKRYFAFPRVGKGDQDVLTFLRDYPAFL